MSRAGTEGPVVLVTGGGGFLGKALVRELHREGAPLAPAEVRVLDVEPAVEVEGDRVAAIRGDVRSPADLDGAMKGADVVLHTAAVVDWGNEPDELLWSVNVEGTENVIDACRRHGVRALVYTSSEDAVYAGDPIVEGDETLPYPARFPNTYCRTKAQAEQIVAAAAGPELRTLSLRPCGMYGEGDVYHVGSLLEMARRGVCFRIGDGTAKYQNVYVGNVAHAHLLAARALLDGDDSVSGQVYFVTDSPGKNFFEFYEPVVRGVGYRMRPPSQALPCWLMYAVGGLSEAIAFALRPLVRIAPTVTRFSVSYVSHEVTYRGDKLARDLGYRPVYTEEEALERTTRWFRERWRQRQARQRPGVSSSMKSWCRPIQ